MIGFVGTELSAYERCRECDGDLVLVFEEDGAVTVECDCGARFAAA